MPAARSQGALGGSSSVVSSDKQVLIDPSVVQWLAQNLKTVCGFTIDRTN
jgi:hypothetical protein